LKKLEGEVDLLRVHNRLFEARVIALEGEMDREKLLPKLLQSFKTQVFDRVRKIAEHVGPGGIHINLHLHGV